MQYSSKSGSGLAIASSYPCRYLFSLTFLRRLIGYGALFLFCIAWMPTMASAQTTGGRATRPNVIFILLDDFGHGDFGVFWQAARATKANRHEPWHFTPAMDRIAAEGMRLPQHYVSAPVCAPSRASLLQGVHQGHANVRDNQFDKALENHHTMASVLQSAGYRTVAIGKYGLQGDAKGKPPQWPAHPNRRGFQEFYGYMRHADGHEHYPKEGITRGPKEIWHNRSEVSQELDKCYTTDLFTARAKQYLISHSKQSSDQPFFMYLAYDTPHAALTLPTGPYPDGSGATAGLQWIGKKGRMINTAEGQPDSYYHPDYLNATWDDDQNPGTPEVAWPDVQKRYATVVRRIDDGLGDLMATLKDLKLDENTVVVVTSDNGPSIESYLKENYSPQFFRSFGPYDGIKRDLWEGGINPGALVRWPKAIKPGTTSSDWATTTWDWLPTFAEAAGVQPPARCDGVSLLPLLTGQGEQRPSTVYLEYFQNGRTPNFDEFAASRRNADRNQMQMLREGKYVGVRYNILSHEDDFEIYDVTADPGQRTNLAAQMPELQTALKARVLRLRRPNASATRPYDDVPIPSLTAEVKEPKLQWQFYAGKFDWVPIEYGLTSTASGTASSFDLPSELSDQAGVIVYRGHLHVKESGRYRFELNSSSNAIIRLHEACLIDADAKDNTGETSQAEVVLAKGQHPITVRVLQTPGNNNFDLRWAGPHFESGADLRTISSEDLSMSNDAVR